MQIQQPVCHPLALTLQASAPPTPPHPRASVSLFLKQDYGSPETCMGELGGGRASERVGGGPLGAGGEDSAVIWGRAGQAGLGKSQWGWNRRREGGPAATSCLLFILSQIWNRANSTSIRRLHTLAHGADSAHLFLA